MNPAGGKMPPLPFRSNGTGGFQPPPPPRRFTRDGRLPAALTLRFLLPPPVRHRYDLDMEAPASPFFDPRREVIQHRNRLPHWQQEQRLQFVTFHLGDALPAEALRQLSLEQETWRARHPEPWSETLETEYHRLFSDRLHDWLDAGRGSCLLRDPHLSQIVLDALLHFDGSRFRLDALAIMPTHVHVLFQLAPDHKLEDVVHSWKSYSSKRLNETLRRTGAVWMKDYWDRMIRSPEHGWKTREYILANPAKARLPEGHFRIWQRNPPLLAEMQ